MKIAQRIQTIPPYLFAEIDKKKEEALKRGVDIINLGIGDPDQPTPDNIIEKLRESVNNSDLINADGQAVVWASRFLGKPLKERVSGIDLMEQLVEYFAQNHDKLLYAFALSDAFVKASSAAA